MRSTFVVRIWLPDRPGALGAVASRIGSVRGDVVGIEILERGAGRAIDELAVELPHPDLVHLLVDEISQVDGVDVEDIRPIADALHDPRLDALETAARLVGTSTRGELEHELVAEAARSIGAEWAALVDLDGDGVAALFGAPPPAAWLAAFVTGSRSSNALGHGEAGPDDVLWAPMPAAGMALVLGRGGAPYRARERRQAAALARIADTRWRELRTREGRRAHPAGATPAPSVGGPPPRPLDGA